MLAQAVGAENTGASPGGNRTGGNPPNTADGHVVAAAPSTSGTETKTKARKPKLSRKTIKSARATPEHGKNAVPSDPPEADPHESHPPK